MADVTRDPRPYELMAVFIPDLSDEDLGTEIDRVSGFITDQQATITEVLTDNPWGRRRLAYTMRFNGVDYRDGIYAVFHFDSLPSAVAEIERELKLDNNLIRYLLVHDDPLAGEKSQPNDGSTEDGDEEAAPAAESTEEAASDVADAAPEAGETVAEAAPAEAEAVTEAAPATEEAPAAEGATDSAPEAESEPAEAPATDDAGSEATTTEE